MATAAPALMSAEQFGRRPAPGYPEELVRGGIVRMPPPNRRHGQVCSRIARIIGGYVDEHDLGHVLRNDSGVITERNPDTVRGADIAFYSYGCLPRGPLPFPTCSASSAWPSGASSIEPIHCREPGEAPLASQGPASRSLSGVSDTSSIHSSPMSTCASVIRKSMVTTVASGAIGMTRSTRTQRPVTGRFSITSPS